VISDERADPADARLDAAGRCVVPGFVDSHTHLDFCEPPNAELVAAAEQAGELAYFPLWSYAHPKAIELAERLAVVGVKPVKQLATTWIGERLEHLVHVVRHRPPIGKYLLAYQAGGFSGGGRPAHLQRKELQMPGFIGLPELLLLGLVVLLVFGPKRLPEMGRSMGRGMREFKDSITGDHDKPELPPPSGDESPPPSS